eukprot:tig00000792_g4192.t1
MFVNVIPLASPRPGSNSMLASPLRLSDHRLARASRARGGAASGAPAFHLACKASEADGQRRGAQEWRRCLAGLAAAASIAASGAGAAHAVYNPELLPADPTPIIDLTNAFPRGEEKRLADELIDFEKRTGWKLRVISSFPDNTPGTALNEFWGLPDKKAVVVISNPASPNILSFSAGDDVYALLPRAFWLELQGRLGNKFTIKELGEDKAISQALLAIETCLEREGGCRAVPGISTEQYNITLATSLIGGFFAGLGLRVGQREGEARRLNWAWFALFSPLWGTLFIGFGVGPIVSRTPDILPLAQNTAAFVGAAALAYLLPIFKAPPAEEDRM